MEESKRHRSKVRALPRKPTRKRLIDKAMRRPRKRVKGILAESLQVGIE